MFAPWWCGRWLVRPAGKSYARVRARNRPQSDHWLTSLYGDVMDAAHSSPRLATPDDAGEVARLLHDFNIEFETPSPGVDILATRLRALLGGDETIAILASTPAVGVALI